MPNSPAPIVSLRDVRFAWNNGGRHVLDIPALDVGKGERVFIKGASGSGKTTLLNLLAGVIVPGNGAVTVLDTRLDALAAWRRDTFRAEHIGFVFQMFNLLPYLSLIDNVTLPCGFSLTRRARALKRSGSLEAEAERLLNHLKLDVGALAGQPVSRLSVGQQQRVAVARALMGGPEVVIADEPTSALDADARASFLDLLFKEVAENDATLIFVSHDSALETFFERTVHLADVNRAGGACA